jgi:hypothetical protein
MAEGAGIESAHAALDHRASKYKAAPFAALGNPPQGATTALARGKMARRSRRPSIQLPPTGAR